MKRLAWATVLVLVGCGGGGEGAARGGGEGGGETQATGPRGEATLHAMVKFEGTPPTNPVIDMADEPDCVAKFEGTPMDPKVVVSAGNLANVFVYVKGGLPAGATYSAPSTPVVVDQDGCLYKPRVLGAMAGQPIELRNSDPTAHNIKAVPTENRPFNISQPRAGMTTTRTFNTPEVMVPLECNVHGWMNAYIGVMGHPFFGTTGPDGTVAIQGLPAGTYEVEAWHEVFGTQTMTVEVPATGMVHAPFTFSATS